MIPLDKESKQVYDLEWINKPELFLKGIGRYCKCGCKRHIIGRPDKQFFNSSCRNRWCKKIGTVQYSYGSPKTLQAQISLVIEPDGTRKLRLYLNKREKKEIKLTRSESELWRVLDQIAKFRNLKIPLSEILA